MNNGNHRRKINFAMPAHTLGCSWEYLLALWQISNRMNQMQHVDPNANRPTANRRGSRISVRGPDRIRIPFRDFGDLHPGTRRLRPGKQEFAFEGDHSWSAQRPLGHIPKHIWAFFCKDIHSFLYFLVRPKIFPRENFRHFFFFFCGGGRLCVLGRNLFGSCSIPILKFPEFVRWTSVVIRETLVFAHPGLKSRIHSSGSLTTMINCESQRIPCQNKGSRESHAPWRGNTSVTCSTPKSRDSDPGSPDHQAPASVYCSRV